MGDRKKGKTIVCSTFSKDPEIGFPRNTGISCFLWMGLGCSVQMATRWKISRFRDLGCFRVR